MTITDVKSRTSDRKTKKDVSDMLDLFYYNYGDAVNPASRDALQALPDFLVSLVEHHNPRNIPLPRAYSDEGDVALLYPTIREISCFVYLELPKMKGSGRIYLGTQKVSEFLLGEPEENFWNDLDLMLETIYE